MIKLKELFKVLIICHFVLLQVSFVLPEIQPRISGGTVIRITQAPFIVQLLNKVNFVCGGTLISTRFVVTAAHCVEYVDPRYLNIIIRATNRNKGGLRHKVSKIKVHHRYSSSRIVWDVAVLRLRRQVTNPGIHTIGLCTESWKPDADVHIYGWGKVNNTDMYGSTQLRMATVKVIDNSTCSKLIPKYIELDGSIFCATTRGSKDACSAVINGEFCGVIAAGIGCANRYFSGIYTNVRSVLTFIRNAMKKMENRPSRTVL